MADINLTLDGDASGAVGAFKETGEATGDLAQQTGKAVVAWQLMAEVATKAASAAVKYGIDAVKAFAQAERVQAQLTRAAGDYGEVLGEQAEAMSKLYAVDDDLIKQSYTLISQWGGAGAATEEVTKAVLNYAAATGTNAVAATEALIRNVESGGTGLAKMGIHFTETGKKGDDLAAAVAAINKKLGGAAAADAGSLVGSAHAAELAVDDLKKSIGGMLGGILQKSGALDAITLKIRQFTKGAEVAFAVLSRLPGVAGAVLRGDSDIGTAADTLTQTATDAFLGGGDATAGALPPVDNGLTNQGRKDAEAGSSAAADKLERSRTIEQAEFNREYARKYQEEQLRGESAAAAESIRIEEARVAALKEEDAAFLANAEENLARKKEIDQGYAKSAEDSIKAAIQARDRGLEASRQQMLREEQAWADAGTAIGMALVNSVATALEQLANGSDMDAGEMMANIIGDILAVAGQVIGTAVGAAYGGAGGAQLGGAIGGAAGGLAGAGVKALGKAGRKPRTYHDGGEIEGWPRFHSGAALGPGEVPLIAEEGEHMLSRRDVANMGGHAGVEAAKAGGGRFHFTINTIDSQGTRQFFENDGGRGFLNALRTGRGSLLPAFGGA